MPTELPGAPGSPDVSDVKDTSMVLNWIPPAEKGGCKLDGYIIEYRADGFGSWVRPSSELVPDLEYTVRKLITDKTYEFRVAAKNKVGLGPFSFSSKPVKAGQPIGKLFHKF